MSDVLDIEMALEHRELRLGVLEARGVTCEPSSEALRERIGRAIAELPPAWPEPDVRQAIRDLLRGHGYKPTGRNKPASEFLVGAAQREAFPLVNNLVDINNLVSLQRCWPMSILDKARALGDAPGLELRLGHDDEAYVFNTAGHEIRLAGLLGVARRGGPMIGNPVKDAMVAKVDTDTGDVVVFVYTSSRVVDEALLDGALAEYAALLEAHAGAHQVRWMQHTAAGGQG